jgi:pimeloyl-ACP methyl ester carboxylesterase
MRDVIVCIPGITGSVLRKNGRDVWNISGGAVFNALRSLGDSIGDLKLERDPVDVDDVDGMTAPSTIRDVHLIPGIWKIDGYTKLIEHIKDKFDVEWNQNLFELPYDWRRDNRVASRQLATKAERWLDAWRKKGHPDAKLVLVGHSMGGLIARHYLECREGWRDTRTLVTFGTPYGGSMNALGTLVNGKKIKFFDLTEIARSLTALYQLLPVYRCYDERGDGNFVRVAEAKIPHLDAAKATAALAFHHEIRDAVKLNMKIPEYRDARYDIRPIVGIEQPTNQSAVRDGDRVKLLRSRGQENVGGDGTVPRPSATPAEFEHHENEIYSPERHASLQNDDDVLFQLRGILTQTFKPGDWRAAATKIAQSLDVEDTYLPTEPIRVRTRPLDDPGAVLVAEAENVETGEKTRRQLAATGDGWYEAELGPLAEGSYRVSSIGATIEPVTDLVTVIAE